MVTPADPDGSEDPLGRAQQMERFLYLAVHELKAPLRAVDNLSQWIQDDLGAGASASVSENLALLRGRVRRMAGLLEALQLYAKADQVGASPEDVDLGALAREVAAGLPSRPGIEVVVGQALPSVRAAKEPLRLVLGCLMDNAVRHHDKPRGRVEVSAVLEGARILLTVRDDGPGIPAAHQERVFQMFQTLKPRDETEGNGVGLAIVKKALRSHGAGVRLDSKPGSGCAFTVDWPAEPGASGPKF